MSRDDDALDDILYAARMIEQFISESDRESFLNDLKTQSAVMHQLIVIGEATKRLSNACRRSHPSTPWRFTAGMRDKLTHQYDAANLEEVWATASRDIPVLIAQIEPLVPPASE
jgi:uncharacterized protein with HEPN domain